MTIGLVLDASALAAYTRGADDVATLIARTAGEDGHVVVPALSLATAYREAADDAWPYLDVLVTLPHCVVAPVTAQDCLFIGGWARHMGSLELAQVGIEAANAVVPIVTAHREALTRVLPIEWPILDLT